MRRLARAKTVLSAVVRESRAENLAFLAGSIAYHAFVSLVPLLFLLLFALSAVGSEALARAVVVDLISYITPTGVSDGGTGGLLVRVAERAAADPQVSVLGGLALGWAVLKIFRGLDTAFSDVYESSAENTVGDQLRDAVVVFGGIAVAVAVVVAADSLVRLADLGPVGFVLRPLVTVAGVSLALLPMYYVFPDEDVSVREVLPGTVVAAVGWMLLSQAFRLYVGVSGKSAMYGLVGTVLVFITWLYVAGFVLLLGAVVNAVLAGRSDDVRAVAWGEGDGADGHAADDDAAFVAPLRELEARLADGDAAVDGPVRLRAGGVDVELPPPDEAAVALEAVDRPQILGGDRESGELRLRWDARSS